jgi:hypothetical protein
MLIGRLFLSMQATLVLPLAALALLTQIGREPPGTVPGIGGVNQR